MKVVKITLAALGLIALTVAGAMLFMAVMVDIKVVWEIATRYSTSTTLKDPRQSVAIISGLAAVAGLLLGLGIGLPSRLPASAKKFDELVEQRVSERLASATQHSEPEATEVPEAPNPQD